MAHALRGRGMRVSRSRSMRRSRMLRLRGDPGLRIGGQEEFKPVDLEMHLVPIGRLEQLDQRFDIFRFHDRCHFLLVFRHELAVSATIISPAAFLVCERMAAMRSGRTGSPPKNSCFSCGAARIPSSLAMAPPRAPRYPRIRPGSRFGSSPPSTALRSIKFSDGASDGRGPMSRLLALPHGGTP